MNRRTPQVPPQNPQNHANSVAVPLDGTVGMTGVPNSTKAGEDRKDDPAIQAIEIAMDLDDRLTAAGTLGKGLIQTLKGEPLGAFSTVVRTSVKKILPEMGRQELKRMAESGALSYEAVERVAREVGRFTGIDPDTLVKKTLGVNIESLAGIPSMDDDGPDDGPWLR